ncbi:MAG: flagellar basal body P-ring protein FlgI [Desulfobacterales bacterium]|nr:flagellar basal body P-ring protein FlgI [Desulfobacterales bacterium]
MKYLFRKILAACLMVLICFVAGPADGARIKDMAAIKGVRSNQLTGYGLVVGLNGTGDGNILFTRQSLTNMLKRMNIHFDKSQVSVKNVAAVMATASIPPFARIGDRIDITISSLGDAKSLKGGTLLMMPLKGIDGNIYAIAQGQVSLAIPAGAGDRDSHLLTARIINGATVEREIPYNLDGKKKLVLSLFRPDFTTARRVADTINAALGDGIAQTIDASAIGLNVPVNMQKKNVAEFIADIESLAVIPDSIAKVVINERTGTVVIGNDVTISGVAVAHGDLSVVINEPQGNAPPGQASVMELPGTSTIGELVNGLNSLGVKPRDLISILESIKAAGALQAKLEIL